MDGLVKIVKIKASINKGLSPELRAAFPCVNPVVFSPKHSTLFFIYVYIHIYMIGCNTTYIYI